MKRDKKLDNLIKNEIRSDENSLFLEQLIQMQTQNCQRQSSEINNMHRSSGHHKILAMITSIITAMVLLCVVVAIVVIPTHDPNDGLENVLLSNLNKEMHSYEFVESDKYSMSITSIEDSNVAKKIGYKVFYVNSSETEQFSVRTYFKEKSKVPDIPQYTYNGRMRVGAYEFVYAEQFVPERDDFFVIHVNGYIDTPFERVFVDYGYSNSTREHNCFDLLNELLKQK